MDWGGEHLGDPAGARYLRLTATGQSLRRCTSVGELLAVAAEAARTECEFGRAAILGVSGRALTAVDTDSLRDPASDQLRRAVLAGEVTIAPGSLEDALIATPECAAIVRTDRKSTLGTALGLQQFILYPIRLEGRCAAMIVLDRAAPEVMPCERALVSCYAMLVAIALDRILTRQKTEEVASELRHLTAFSHALMREAIEQPLALPSACAQSTIAALFAPTSIREQTPAQPFTAQELRVVRLLTRGLSNPEIAAELVLGVETVKSHVTHIFHKIGVSNRAQAAAVLATMARDTSAAVR